MNTQKKIKCSFPPKQIKFKKKILKTENNLYLSMRHYWPFEQLHHFQDERLRDWEDINKQFKEEASQ